MRSATVVFLAALFASPIDAAQTNVLFLGDTSFGENYFAWLEKEGEENVLKTSGYDHSLKNFKAILSEADFVIANLETPITDLRRAPPSHKSKNYIHWTHVEHAPQTLKEHGIQAVSLANNHTLDFGLPGLAQTTAILDRYGIAYFGGGMDESRAKTPLIKRLALGGCEFEVALFGRFEYLKEYDRQYDFYSKGNKGGAAVLDANELAASIARLKSERPRIFAVVYPHWGENYHWKSEEQTKTARALIDAGANLVIGHGAHMMQEIERYRDTWIVYGIGNFVFNSLGRYADNDVLPVSFVAKLTATTREKAIDVNLRLYPIFSDNKITRYQPRFLTAKEFAETSQALRDQSGIKEPLRSGHDAHAPYLELDIERHAECQPVDGVR